jgi:hypothetical protein
MHSLAGNPTRPRRYLHPQGSVGDIPHRVPQQPTQTGGTDGEGSPRKHIEIPLRPSPKYGNCLTRDSEPQRCVLKRSRTYAHRYIILRPLPLHPTLLLILSGLNMHRRIFSRRSLAVASLATGSVLGGGYYYLNSGPSYPLPSKETRRPPPSWTPPSRKEMLDALAKSGSDLAGEFDVLIVGGGATGAGVAVDAATRGLKVALVERDDFSSGA